MDLNSTETVQALLATLGQSQEWRNAASLHDSSAGGRLQESGVDDERDSAPQASGSYQGISQETRLNPWAQEPDAVNLAQPSVASLLAQLNVPASNGHVPTDSGFGYGGDQWQQVPGPSNYAADSYEPQAMSFDRPQSSNEHGPTSVEESFRSEQAIRDDRRKYSYKQALPVIGELAQDEAFVEAINQMKKEQDDLEKLLHSQRREITSMHEGKVKVAKQRANIIGQPITRHDALMLNDNWKKALAKFDREKVLPLWDDLVSRQQQKLEKMGVPTMFETEEQDEREKQQKLVKVMENLV